jgi:hypothetical protein
VKEDKQSLAGSLATSLSLTETLMDGLPLPRLLDEYRLRF